MCGDSVAVCMNIECLCMAPFVRIIIIIGLVLCLQTRSTSQINRICCFFSIFSNSPVLNQIELNLYRMNNEWMKWRNPNLHCHSLPHETKPSQKYNVSTLFTVHMVLSLEFGFLEKNRLMFASKRPLYYAAIRRSVLNLRHIVVYIGFCSYFNADYI